MTEQEYVERKANERQYQTEKRVRESEHETVEPRASVRQKKRKSLTEKKEHKALVRQNQARLPSVKLRINV